MGYRLLATRSPTFVVHMASYLAAPTYHVTSEIEATGMPLDSIVCGPYLTAQAFDISNGTIRLLRRKTPVCDIVQ